MLQKLQKNWMIESLDFHVKGYWELDSTGKAFDLTLLQSKPETSKSSTYNVPYLTTRNNQNIIQFEPSAFYELDRIEEQKLILTYYAVLENEPHEELVRVFTIRLMM